MKPQICRVIFFCSLGQWRCQYSINNTKQLGLLTCALCLRGYLDPVDDTNQKIFCRNRAGVLSQTCREQNCPFKEVCALHESNWTRQNLHPRSGHVASVSTSSSGSPWEKWQEKSLALKASICKHWRTVLSGRYKAKRPWPKGFKVKMTHCGKLKTAWHILAAGPYIRDFVISEELVNYLISLK